MTETPVEKPFKVFLLAAGSTAVFAGMNLFVKLASETQSVPQIMFFRNALAMVPILYFMLLLKDRAVFRTARPKDHFIRAGVGLCGMVCGFSSFALLPMAQATAINFASPLILTALSVPLLKEKVGPHRFGAVIVGLFAVLFMLQPTGEGSHLGNGLALLGACFGAFAMISVRRLGATEHALTIVFYFTLAGIIAGFIGMLFFWKPIVTPVSLVYLIATGLFGGIGQILLTYSYANAPAAYVSPFAYLAIIFSALFDIVIWGNVPGWNTLIGSGVIILCGLYVIFREVLKYGKAHTTTAAFDSPAQPTERDEADPL